MKRRSNPYARSGDVLARLKSHNQLFVSKLNLSFPVIEQLQRAFVSFSLKLPKQHSDVLGVELSELAEGKIPQKPGRYMPSLVVYAFTGKFYDVKASYISYEKTQSGFELQAIFWYATLLRNKQGRDFKTAIESVAMKLRPNLADLKEGG